VAKQDFKYKFSFVMPVYNVEDYLAESIESILAQTMDFERNCELILINDGSPDNSEEVCLRYQQQFPGNIKYIKQKNQGVSAARNRGLEVMEGKYVSFLDSDDKLSPDTLATVYRFFEKHYGKTDLVAIKMQFFGSSESGHPLNSKFEAGDRIIDLEEEYQCRQFSSSSAFFKAEAIQGKHFDKRLLFVEDGKFVSEVLADKLKLGVVSQPVYYYRRRHDNSSAVNGMTRSLAWYFDTPKYFWLELVERSKKLHSGKLPKYIQALLVYELRWRFTQKILRIEDDQLREYKAILAKVLHDIDDEIIMECSGVYPEYRIHMLNVKYGRDITPKLQYRSDGGLYFNNVKVYEAQNNLMWLDFIKIQNGNLLLEGWHGGFKDSDFSVYIDANTKRHQLTKSYQPYTEKWSLGEVIYVKRAFTATIPLNAEKTVLHPVMEVMDNKIGMRLFFGRFAKLHRRTFSYRHIGDYLVESRGDALIIRRYTKVAHLLLETMYLAVLCRGYKYKPALFRVLHYAYRFTYRNKQVWLMSDRATMAGDNATYLFKYATKQKVKNRLPYFAVSKTAPQFSELRKAGRVVAHGSFKYKQLFLLADKLISSQFDEYVINPFGGAYYFYRDLLHSDFVYLEHGVLAADLSEHINRFKKNISLITTASEQETKAIIADKNYGYNDQQAKTTGHPRFDGLKSKPKGKMIIMPTWRLSEAPVSNTNRGVSDGTRSYSKQFKESAYFKFYNNLINDERIIQALKSHNMTGEFYVHPNHSAQWKDYRGNDTVTIMPPPHNYEKGLSEGNIMVTDYSGVAFDFAYMQKPVIYAQFDHDSFYKGHTYKAGYFSFDSDGFGPVTHDYEETIEAIQAIINNGCTTPVKYQKRVEKFFYKLDSNNSKRVYEEVENR